MSDEKSQPVTHDALVLHYLMQMGRQDPLLASHIERAKLLVDRDLREAEIARLRSEVAEQRRHLNPVESVEDEAADG